MSPANTTLREVVAREVKALDVRITGERQTLRRLEEEVASKRELVERYENERRELLEAVS